MESSPRVIHHIIDALGWPSPVEHIAKLLARPLPLNLRRGPYPYVSPRAVALLPELSNNVIVSDYEYHEFSMSRPVTDVFDTALSTVADMRDLIQQQGHGYRRPGTPLWDSLIYVLGYTLSKDFLILGQVPFILPRWMWLSDDGPIDGLASTLICHVIEKSILSSHLQSSEMDTSPASVDISPMNEDGVSINFPEPLSESSSESPIDLPFDAHVLLGSGKRLCVVLPIICVADEENIIRLITSVLYQRRVLGIIEPVVGIACSRSGIFGRLILGWIDPQYNDEYLPPIHIAHSTPSAASNPLNGIFDFTDPISTFCFAQFVLGLDSHLRAIRNASCQPDPTTLHWRPDYIPNKWQSTEERVAEWARGLTMLDDSVDDSSDPFPSPDSLACQRSEQGSEAIMASMKPSRDGQRSGSQKSVQGSSSHSVPPLDTAPINEVKMKHNTEKQAKAENKPPTISVTSVANDVKFTAATPAPSKEKPNLACSDFAKIAAKKLAKHSTSSWLFDRCAVGLSRIEINPALVLEEDLHPVVDEINQKIKFYDKMTSFQWPKMWDTIEAIPPTDSSLTNVREVFWGQYERFCELQNIQRSEKEKKPVRVTRRSEKSTSSAGNQAVADDRFQLPQMTVDDGHFIAGRISTLFSATSKGFSLASNTQGDCEMASRSPWDNVMQDFYATSSHGISLEVLIERTLNLPRNPAADYIIGQNSVLRETKLSLADSNLAILRLQSSMPNYPPMVEYDASQAQSASALVKKELNAFADDAYADSVRKNCSRDPHTGRCDAVLALPVTLRSIAGDEVDVDMKEWFSDYPFIQKSGSNSTRVSKDRITSNLAFPQRNKPSKNLIKSMLETSCTETALVDSPSLPSVSVLPEEAILLPVMCVEHKKTNAPNDKQVLNQIRIYCVSAVRFLANLGIRGFPVFGLFTAGHIGGVILTWHSEKIDRIFTLERHIRTYDLTKPLQFFQFAFFLVRLRDQRKELEALIDLKKSEICEQAKKRLAWTQRAQAIQLGLPVQEDEVATESVESAESEGADEE